MIVGNTEFLSQLLAESHEPVQPEDRCPSISLVETRLKLSAWRVMGTGAVGMGIDDYFSSADCKERKKETLLDHHIIRRHQTSSV